MEQVYKNLYREGEDYFVATDTNTIKIKDVQTLLSCYIVELMSEKNMNKSGEEDAVPELSN